MEKKTMRNIQFTKLIKANGRLREFNFRKMRNIDGDKFSVDVCDDRGNRIVFFMTKEDKEWGIVEKNLPSWISINEATLGQSIEEEDH
jgi:hypothetical protein